MSMLFILLLITGVAVVPVQSGAGARNRQLNTCDTFRNACFPSHATSAPFRCNPLRRGRVWGVVETRRPQ